MTIFPGDALIACFLLEGYLYGRDCLAASKIFGMSDLGLLER